MEALFIDDRKNSTAVKINREEPKRRDSLESPLIHFDKFSSMFVLTAEIKKETNVTEKGSASKKDKLSTIQESQGFQLNDNMSLAESLQLNLHEEHSQKPGQPHTNSLGPHLSRFSFVKDSEDSRYPVSDMVKLFTTKTLIKIQEAQEEQGNTFTDLNLSIPG
jgi:hypothetical protein